MEDCSAGYPRPEKTLFDSSHGTGVYAAPIFHKSLLKMISMMQSNSILTDVTLEVDNSVFSVHRLVLAGISPYFRAMFWGGFKEISSEKVVIKEVSSSAMRCIVSYMYSGTISLSVDTVLDILSAAVFFQIEDVIHSCKIFLAETINAANAIDVLLAAKLYSFMGMYDTSLQFIIQNYQQIVNNDTFLSLNLNELKNIVSQDDLIVENENFVSESLLKWSVHNTETDLNILSLLTTIRFQYLSPSYFNKLISSKALVTMPTSLNYLRLKGSELNTHELPLVMERKVRSEEVYLIGGCKSSNILLDMLVAFNIKTGISRDIVRHPSPRQRMGCAVVGGKLYTVGGEDSQSVERYCPLQNSWESCELMLSKHTGAAVAVLDDMIYVCGGSTGKTCLNTVEKYDAINNKWMNIAPMKRCRKFAGAAVVNRRIYVIGGFDGTNALSSCECYTPETNSWQEIASRPRSCYDASVVSCQGALYVIGGQDGNSFTSTVDKFCVSSGLWKNCTSLTYTTANHACCAINGEIFIFGGRNGQILVNTCKFNVESVTWVNGPNLPIGQYYHSCVVVKDALF